MSPSILPGATPQGPDISFVPDFINKIQQSIFKRGAFKPTLLKAKDDNISLSFVADSVMDSEASVKQHVREQINSNSYDVCVFAIAASVMRMDLKEHEFRDPDEIAKEYLETQEVPENVEFKKSEVVLLQVYDMRDNGISRWLGIFDVIFANKTGEPDKREIVNFGIPHWLDGSKTDLSGKMLL